MHGRLPGILSTSYSAGLRFNKPYHETKAFPPPCRCIFISYTDPLRWFSTCRNSGHREQSVGANADVVVVNERLIGVLRTRSRLVERPIKPRITRPVSVFVRTLLHESTAFVTAPLGVPGQLEAIRGRPRVERADDVDLAHIRHLVP